MATQSRVSQVACHSRELAGHFWRLVREGYTEIFAAQLAAPLRVRLLVAKNTQQNFSNFRFEVFWQVNLATLWRLTSVTKIACFSKWAHFQHFSQKERGSHLLVLHSVSVHFLVLLSLIQHHCGNLQILSPNCYHSIYLQGKVWVLFSTLCFSQLLPFHHGFCVLFGIHISLTRVWLLECMMFSFLCGFNMIHSIL